MVALTFLVGHPDFAVGFYSTFREVLKVDTYITVTGYCPGSELE
jgi:hypothetical protein